MAAVGAPHPSVWRGFDIAVLFRVGPPPDIEQAEPPFVEAVAALDAAPPPLAEVVAGAEQQQFVLVLMCPPREAEIVVVRRDPARAAASEELSVFANEDAGVRAVNLLGGDDIAVQPRDLPE